MRLPQGIRTINCQRLAEILHLVLTTAVELVKDVLLMCTTPPSHQLVKFEKHDGYYITYQGTQQQVAAVSCEGCTEILA